MQVCNLLLFLHLEGTDADEATLQQLLAASSARHEGVALYLRLRYREQKG